MSTTTSSNTPKFLGFTALAVVVALLVAWLGSFNGQPFAGSSIGIYFFAVVATLVIQWIAFIPALLTGSEKPYDLMGGVGFIAGTIFVLIATPELNFHAYLLAAMVILWSARLASFLFIRIMNSGKDSRFDDIKSNWPRFLLTWTLQGLWISFVAAAAWIGITSEKMSEVNWVTFVGVAVWLFGLGFEIVADLQKNSWRNRQEGDGAFINEGLWTISRHPNYFGEIVLWIGVIIVASTALSGWQWIAVISPLFATFLLTKVSGIPMQQKSAEKRWGGQEDWEEYKRTTPVLVPIIGKKG